MMLAGFRSRWMMPLLVRGTKRVGNLPGDGDGVTDRQGARGDPIGERVSVDELENRNWEPSTSCKAVDGADVRMIQRGEQLRLALEPSDVRSDRRRRIPAAL